MSLINDGTEESYFPAISSSFNPESISLCQGSTWTFQTEQDCSITCCGEESSSSTHTWARSRYHAPGALVDPLASPWLPRGVWVCFNSWKYQNKCACSHKKPLRLFRTRKSISGEIIRFLQSADPLPLEMIRWSHPGGIWTGWIDGTRLFCLQKTQRPYNSQKKEGVVRPSSV